MTIDHSAWGGLLKTYVKVSPDGINRFAYSKVTKADRAKLKSYLTTLQSTSTAKLSENEQRAFWANLYNALTIDVVLDHYPVKSIREITFGLFSIGPWGKKFVTVTGRELSLDDIEHKILRKLWKDARVHFSVNCASMGCPNLPDVPFTGKTLDAMLTAGARSYVNHQRGITTDVSGRITASSIFDWYSKDFGNSEKEVLTYLAQFADPPLKAKMLAATGIKSYDYDWTLNDAK